MISISWASRSVLVMSPSSPGTPEMMQRASCRTRGGTQALPVSVSPASVTRASKGSTCVETTCEPLLLRALSRPGTQRHSCLLPMFSGVLAQEESDAQLLALGSTTCDICLEGGNACNFTPKKLTGEKKARETPRRPSLRQLSATGQQPRAGLGTERSRAQRALKQKPSLWGLLLVLLPTSWETLCESFQILEP